MKRIAILLSAALIAVGCTEDRSEILKVYNWSSYIGEGVIEDFEQWYEEQTGTPVHVIYQTFDINETMLSKIEKGHEDYDVVCPSDYIIERMLQADLLQPIDKDFGDTPNYIDANLSPFIRGWFSRMNGGGKDANDYSVGYMWGTTGILYNAKYVSDEDARTWDILRNPKYKGKIFVKDSARDVYSQIIIFLNSQRLIDGEVTLEELMYDSSDASMEAVETYMKEVSDYVAGWEADFGKEQMTQEHAWLNMTWSGDAQWAIDEAAEMGLDLRYACPDEGFTIWFDGWVIPKYARNVKAASFWINFMSRPDIVIRNVDEIGYVSVSGAQEVLDALSDESYDPLDLTYFFGEGADSCRVNPVMYPSGEEIIRSTMEHDWGDETPKLIAMWSRVKGDNANTFTIVVISISFGVLLILGLYKKFFSRKVRSHRRKNRKKSNK